VHPGAPPGLRELCARAVAPNPDDRIASAGDFHRELERVCDPTELREARARMTQIARALNQGRQNVVRAMIHARLEGGARAHGPESPRIRMSAAPPEVVTSPPSVPEVPSDGKTLASPVQLPGVHDDGGEVTASTSIRPHSRRRPAAFAPLAGAVAWP